MGALWACNLLGRMYISKRPKRSEHKAWRMYPLKSLYLWHCEGPELWPKVSPNSAVRQTPTGHAPSPRRTVRCSRSLVLTVYGRWCMLTVCAQCYERGTFLHIGPCGHATEDPRITAFRQINEIAVTAEHQLKTTTQVQRAWLFRRQFLQVRLQLHKAL